MFTGPDGYQYRWRPDPNTGEYVVSQPLSSSSPVATADQDGWDSFTPSQLEDFNFNIIAFYRPIFPAKKYNIGEVHGELCFVANAGSGMVLHPVSIPVSVLRQFRPGLTLHLSSQPLMDMVCLTAMLNRTLNSRNM